MNRGGRYHDYKLSRIYLPALLHPLPEIHWSQRLIELVASASEKLARLDEYCRSNKSAQAAKAMLMRIETMASCAFDKETCTLNDLIAQGEDPAITFRSQRLQGAANYYNELTSWNSESLKNSRSNLETIRKLHRVLLAQESKASHPGEFRRSNLTVKKLDASSFFPPPPHEMIEGLNDLEWFLESKETTILVKVALGHFQFVSLHPFLDGNGRLSRLLNIFLLVQAGVLHEPVLPLSNFLRKNQLEYFKRIEAFRDDDDLEGWLLFMLVGLSSCAEKTLVTLRAIEAMAAAHQELVRDIPNGKKTLNTLLGLPIITVQSLAKHLDCSFLTAQRVITELVSTGLLVETTGNKRNRVYEYRPYLSYLWPEMDDLTPDDLRLSADNKEHKFWTKSVRYSLEQLRQYILGAGLSEQEWTITEDYPSLVGLFSVAPIDLQITFRESDRETEIQMRPEDKLLSTYSGKGPYLYLEASIENRTERSWGFKLEVKDHAVKWNPLWGQYSAALTVNEVARLCLKEFFQLTAIRGIATAKDTSRTQELTGKERLIEMFLAIRNVLGRQTDGDIYWEDDNTGANVVYHYDDTRFMLYFSLAEIIGFTANEQLQQRLRERIVENIRALPIPPPRQ
jgi:Fic family protein